ncbi:MAG TPA: phosphoribosyltransferase family protein [Devosiaceae bacterium]
MWQAFEDRIAAGQALAGALAGYHGTETVVLALPRGGVPVAAEVARKLGAPLDLVLVRKIGAPQQPELAVGAIADGSAPSVFVNSPVAAMLGLANSEVEAMGEKLLPEIERRRAAYLEGRLPVPLKGKTAILVDDGIATGASIRAALMALAAREPAKVVLAVPVAPRDTIDALADAADEIVCLETPEPFLAVGNHYRRFDQTDDSEVVALLRQFALGWKDR